MTELLSRAVRAARDLPPDIQDEIARVMLAMASSDEDGVYVLSDEEERSLALSRAQSARGDYASDDEVRAIWAKHGL